MDLDRRGTGRGPGWAWLSSAELSGIGDRVAMEFEMELDSEDGISTANVVCASRPMPSHVYLATATRGYRRAVP